MPTLTAEKVARQKRVDRKLAIMASQTASPAEAEVAKNLLVARRATAEVAPPDERLAGIAEDIKAEWGRGIEAQFAIGRLLMDARAMFPGKEQDKAFSRWLKAQEFPFGQTQAWRLRSAAEREPEVRAYLAAHATRTGKPGPELGIAGAIVYMARDAKTEREEKVDPVDPAYAALRTARNLILGNEDEPTNAFVTMHLDDLAKSAGFIKELAAAYTEAKAAR